MNHLFCSRVICTKYVNFVFEKNIIKTNLIALSLSFGRIATFSKILNDYRDLMAHCFKGLESLYNCVSVYLNLKKYFLKNCTFFWKKFYKFVFSIKI